MKVIYSASTLIVPILVYPYVSRVIGPEGIGKVNFAESVIWYFLIIATLGIPNYGIRACAQVRDDKEALSQTVQEILIISIATCAISYILFFITLKSVPQVRNEKILFIVMSADILLKTIGVDWVYSGLEQFKFVTLTSLFFKAIMIVGVFLLVKAKDDYVIYAALYIIGTVGNGIINFIYLFRILKIKKTRKYDFRRHLKPMLFFSGLAVATTIYTKMDATMLGYISGTLENGYYDAAVKIKAVLVTVIASLGAVIMPRASYYIEHNEPEKFDEISEKSLKAVILASLSLCVFFTAFAEPSIMFLSGEQFKDSVLPMKAIMPSVFFIAITNITGLQMLVPLGQEKKVMISCICGAVINLIINALLIPSMGAVGAAIGTVAAELGVLIVQFCYLKEKAADKIKHISWLKIIIANAGALAVSYGITKLSVNSFLILLTGALIYFAIEIILLLLMKEPTTLMAVNEIKKMCQNKLKKNA